LELLQSKDDIIELICESHIEFERIHPFADGSGKTGRIDDELLVIKK